MRRRSLGLMSWGVGVGSLLACVAHVPFGESVIAAVALVAGLSYLAIPLVMRVDRTLYTSTALFSLVSLVSLALALARSGGLSSPGLPWLVALPAGLFAVGGRWHGLVGLIACMGLLFGVWLGGDALAVFAVQPDSMVSPIFLLMHIFAAATVALLLIGMREVALTRALEASSEQLAARIAAEAESRSKSFVLASMSHALRAPLNGVLGTVEVLRGMLDGDKREHVEVIAESGNALLSVLNDILDNAELDVGDVGLAPAPLDPERLVASVLKLYFQGAHSVGVALRAEVKGELPKYIVADAQRVRQILLNLLSNAVKFTDQGSVVIRHEVAESEWIIEVQDTGVGIPSDLLATVFEPFAQGQTGAQKRGGTGLGLTICKRLVDRMGGSLVVHSVVGEGTTFTVRIPVTEAVSEAVSEATVPVEGAALDILVAEDNPVSRRVLHLLLDRDGHRVVEVEDGAAAVAVCRMRPFDLVLMDVQMPIQDGLSATRAIRDNPDTAGIRIVALTAGASAQDRRAAMEAGMDAFLAKPVDLQSLRRTIADAAPSISARARQGGALQR